MATTVPSSTHDEEYGQLMVVAPGVKPSNLFTTVGQQQRQQQQQQHQRTQSIVNQEGNEEYSYPTFPMEPQESGKERSSQNSEPDGSRMDTSNQYIVLTSAEVDSVKKTSDSSHGSTPDSMKVSRGVAPGGGDYPEYMNTENVQVKFAEPSRYPPGSTTFRDHSLAPMRKLSVGLIHTYKTVNKAYYQSGRRHKHTTAVPSTDNTRRADPPNMPPTAGKVHTSHHPVEVESTPPTTVPPPDTAAEGQATTAESILRELGLSIGEKLYGRYLVRSLLGRGSFGHVLSVVDTSVACPAGRPNGTALAVKIIQPKTAYIRQAEIEIRILEKIYHLQNKINADKDVSPHSAGAANIVTFYGHFTLNRQLCLVFEQLSYNLYDLLLKTNLTGVSLNLTRKFGQQLCSALAFLARPDMQLIHCDLKPENILLVNPKRSHIKVIDFGSSCRRTEKIYHYIQSRFYRAPEVILGHDYDLSIDMWSLGCILFEMHYGQPLFCGQNETDQMMRIVEILGVPPVEMLHSGKKTRHFFEYIQPTSIPHNLGHATAGFYPVMNRTRFTQGQMYLEPGGRSLWQPMSEVRHRRRVKFQAQQQALGNLSTPLATHEPGHSEDDYAKFVGLLQAMLQYNPRERILPLQALRHPFLDTGASPRSPPLSMVASPLSSSSSSAHSVPPTAVPSASCGTALPHQKHPSQSQMPSVFVDHNQALPFLTSVYANHSPIPGSGPPKSPDVPGGSWNAAGPQAPPCASQVTAMDKDP